ncbi:hypothetical protein DMN91_009987 [Ooceraea biroi]|uniref:KIF-binding protein n=1 Tax=Ooceraea biroi TaxID=2015173 RepID=A0A3L8DB71_OOCBI|nr:uncharacterized protein LOC105282267 isoform X2 [Ooceraea biroi]XP_026829229.1 uncharacterized protein LOC105282267 isoform X2 [Ooceraea biroi]RLU17750.1 hypothetical protein DMN91_009987 [Ooceraea biroi]
MAKASSHADQAWNPKHVLQNYMKLCNRRLFLQQLDTKPEDFTSDFYETLQLSYDAASSHKNKTFTEGSRKTLKVIEDRLSDLNKQVTEGKTNFNNIIALATSYCNMGILYSSYTKEKRLRSGRSHLKRCLELLNGKELNRRAILIVMRATMQLEYIFHKLKEPKQCCPYSHKAIGFYLEYTMQLNSFPMPFVTLSVNLDVEESESTDTIKSMVTLFLNFLAHVKTCKLNKWDPLDLIPIHNFLMNRWTIMSTTVLTEGVTWTNITTAFYSYCLHEKRFSDARNYLAATQYILDEYEKEFNATKEANSLPEDKNIDTEYYDLRVHLDQGWAKYGSALLLHSKYNLSYSQKSGTKKADTSRSTSSIEPKESAEPLTFNWENVDERIKDIASQVTDKYVSNLKDAKAIFVHTTKWYEKNKACCMEAGDMFSYTFPAYNVTLTYKYLECFQPERNMRIKMHKRRVQMLNDIIVFTKGYAPYAVLLKFYMDMFISYGAIIDMMMENAEIAGKPFTEIQPEVLEYVKHCVESWEKYNIAKDKLTKVKSTMNILK